MTPQEPEYEQNSAMAQVNTAQGATNSGAKDRNSADPTWERSTLEKLAQSIVHEQRQARRWRNGIRLAWLAFFIGLVWLGMDRGSSSSDATLSHTAMVKIEEKYQRARMPVPNWWAQPCAARLKTRVPKRWYY